MGWCRTAPEAPKQTSEGEWPSAEHLAGVDPPNDTARAYQSLLGPRRGMRMSLCTETEAMMPSAIITVSMAVPP